MQYESVRMPELKALARDRGLRNYCRMKKAELVALLQNNLLPSQSRASASPIPCTRSPPPPPQRHAAYVTLKFDDNGVAGFTAFLMMGPPGPRLRPITHKEFNEFVKGKGFKGRNNYK